MAIVQRKRRLVNPGRRKTRRKMSPAQIRHFGTKRQKAALKAARKRKPRRTVRKRRTTKRQSNVGEIITIGLAGGNPGTKRRKSSVARRKRRTTRRRTYRRRRNPAVAKAPRRRARRRNYGVARRRRRNYGVSRKRRYGRRRNPSMLSGKMGMFVGMLGGATVTAFAQKFSPFQVGLGSYLSIGVIAALQGTVIGKVSKNRGLGNNMTLGGFFYLGLKIANDFAPGLMANVPIGLRGRRGMGLISGGANFPLPHGPSNVFGYPAPVRVANGMAGIGGHNKWAPRQLRGGRMAA